MGGSFIEQNKTVVLSIEYSTFIVCEYVATIAPTGPRIKAASNALIGEGILLITLSLEIKDVILGLGIFTSAKGT